MKTVLSLLISLAITQTALATELGVNQISCQKMTEIFGHDEVYFIVSVSRDNGTNEVYRYPSTGGYALNPNQDRILQDLPLWQEALFSGQRSIITVSVMESDGAAPHYAYEVGQAIATSVSGAIYRLGGPTFPRRGPLLKAMDRPWLAREVDRLTAQIPDDDRLGQFAVEIWHDFGGTHAYFEGLNHARETRIGPFQSTLDLNGDGSRYQLFLGVNP